MLNEAAIAPPAGDMPTPSPDESPAMRQEGVRDQGQEALRPPFAMLGDAPFVDSASGPDPLAFDVIATDLASLIQGSIEATPMTVGIDGGWGTGKSSLMRR